MVKRIYILGMKGPDTFALERNVNRALVAAGLHRCTVRILEDENTMIEYGVGLLPALVLDGTVRVIGRVPPVEEILNIFRLTGIIPDKPDHPVWSPKLD